MLDFQFPFRNFRMAFGAKASQSKSESRLLPHTWLKSPKGNGEGLIRSTTTTILSTARERFQFSTGFHLLTAKTRYGLSSNLMCSPPAEIPLPK